MRSLAWLSVVILVAVVLSVAFSWFLSSPDRDYLFDGERGISRPEVADWWRIRVPVVIALGIIAGGLLIALLRTTRSRARLESVGSIAVAILGVGAMAAGTHYVELRAGPEPEPCLLPTPHSPEEVYLPIQWRALAWSSERWNPGVPREPLELRGSGVGFQGRPGVIPFDPFILDRITFVGLTLAEVEPLLGPPIPPHNALPAANVNYSMIGYSYIHGRAHLSLFTGDSSDPNSVIVSEGLHFFRTQH